MENPTNEKALCVFNLLLGMYDLNQYSPPQAAYAHSLFRPGSECAALLDRAWAARRRLGARLGTDEEDTDLLELVECYEDLWEKLAVRMYECGQKEPL